MKIGILKRATEAKTRTERATVIELAKTDILGQVAENRGEIISETQLKAILDKYFEEINEELPEDLSETTITLTAKESYGGYNNIALADIYNGKLSKATVESLYYIGNTNDDFVINLFDESNKPTKFEKIYLNFDNRTIDISSCIQNSEDYSFVKGEDIFMIFWDNDDYSFQAGEHELIIIKDEKEYYGTAVVNYEDD